MKQQEVAARLEKRGKVSGTVRGCRYWIEEIDHTESRPATRWVSTRGSFGEEDDELDCLDVEEIETAYRVRVHHPVAGMTVRIGDDDPARATRIVLEECRRLEEKAARPVTPPPAPEAQARTRSLFAQRERGGPLLPIRDVAGWRPAT